MATFLTESFDSYTSGGTALNNQGSWSGDVNYLVESTTVQAGANAVSFGAADGTLR